MSKPKKTTVENPGNFIKHFPIYGKNRRNFDLFLVYLDLNDSHLAKNVNALNSTIAAVILLPDIPPSEQIWEVSGLPCLIIESKHQNKEIIHNLAYELLKCGAISVYSCPRADYCTNLATFDIVNQTWRIERDYIKKYSEEVCNV